MAVDTSRAIGAVTNLLSSQLRLRTTVPAVTQGRPEPAASETGAKLNIFLYEAVPDGPLRSHALEGRAQPVWMTLRYLVTAFSVGPTSDSADAHRHLGEAIRALHGMGYLPISSDLGPADEVALRANPEPLKLTFVQAGSELLGRLMQGSDEKYRCSIAVEIRPVMIASGSPSEVAPLVGVPQRAPAPTDRRLPGVQIELEPSPAPMLSRAIPSTFEAGQRVQLVGSGFVAGDVARLGVVERPIVLDDEQLVVTFPATDLATSTAAGALPLAVARLVPSTAGRITPPPRYRSSVPVTVRLLPIVDSATVSRRLADPMGSTAGNVILDIDLRGELLGRAEDDAVVTLWAAGRTIASSDAVTDVPGAPQSLRRFTVRDVPPSTTPYYVIFRVNGSQAARSPQVEVAP